MCSLYLVLVLLLVLGRCHRFEQDHENRHLLAAEDVEKRLPCARKLLLQLPRAIAVAAGPRLGAVLMAAIPPGVRVFYAQELEVFLPVWPLLRQRRITKTDFHPAHRAVAPEPRLLHIVQIFFASDRAAA